MNFAQRQEQTEHLAFDFEGERVELEVYINILTPRFMQAIFDLQTGKDALGIAERLSKVIKSWNMDWNGEPFPPTFENLANVCDQEFIGAVLEKLFEKFTGDKKKPKK